MSENGSCIEKEALVDHLYGESDAEARSRIDAHLRSCARCAGEFRSLTEVRRSIGAWEPPDADLGFRVVADAGGPAPARFHRRPAWALAAAAVLAAAVAAALVVRPEIEVRSGGSALRIGWSGGGAGVPAESGGVPAESGRASAGSERAPAGSERAPAESDARPSAERPGPTLRGTPAGLRTGGGVSIPGSGVGADPDPLSGDDVLLRRLRELIRDDAAARQELAEYVHRVSERR